MSSIMKILRRIGGTKSMPTSGEAGEIAVWKGGVTPTDPVSLFFHDGTQWVELLDTAGRKVTQAVASSEAAPAAPVAGDLWYKPSTKALSSWDGAQWSNIAFTNVSNVFTVPQVVDVTDNAKPALRVTQKGTGAALVVEDEANPDASPFVIDGAGNVGIGMAPAGGAKLDVVGKAWFQGSPAGGAVLEIAPDVAGGANAVSLSASFLSGIFGPMKFKTSNVDRLEITAAGEFGIGGAATPGTRTVIHGPKGGTSLSLTDDVNSTLNVKHDGIGNITFEGPFASIFRWFTQGVEQLRLDPAGQITSPGTYAHPGTGSAVHVTASGQLVRSASSIKYKKDVEPLAAALTDKAIRELRPIWYRSKNPVGDDRADWSHIGLIAEDVAKVEKRLVNFRTVEITHDDDGNPVVTPLADPIPEDVDYARLSVLLLDYVQRLEKRVATLEARP